MWHNETTGSFHFRWFIRLVSEIFKFIFNSEIGIVYENLLTYLRNRKVNTFITALIDLIILVWNAKTKIFFKWNYFFWGGGCVRLGDKVVKMFISIDFSGYLVLGLLGIKADDISKSEHWSSGALTWCGCDVKSLATFIISLVDDCSDD